MAATKEKNQKTAKVNSIIVPFSATHWDRKLNYRTDYGKETELAVVRASFAERNWDFDFTVNVEPIPDNEKTIAIAEREATWQELKSKAANSADDLLRLQVWEELFTDKGKVIVPEYLGIDGNRRSTVFLEAMIDRRRLQQEIDDEISVRVRHPKDEAERIAILVESNERQTLGRLPVGDIDRVRAAKRMYDLGKNQKFIRDAFTDTTGQKLWCLCELDHRYPGLELVKRLTLPVGDPRHLPYGPIKGAELPKIVMASDPKVLEEKNRKLAAEGKPVVEPTSESSLRNYFFAPKGPGGNKPKIMKREDIEGLAKQNPVNIVRNTIAAVRDDDTSALQTFTDWKEGINAFTDMAEQGDYPLLEQLLLALVQVPSDNRKDLVDQCVDVIKGHVSV